MNKQLQDAAERVLRDHKPTGNEPLTYDTGFGAGVAAMKRAVEGLAPAVERASGVAARALHRDEGHTGYFADCDQLACRAFRDPAPAVVPEVEDGDEIEVTLDANVALQKAVHASLMAQCDDEQDDKDRRNGSKPWCERFAATLLVSGFARAIRAAIYAEDVAEYERPLLRAEGRGALDVRTTRLLRELLDLMERGKALEARAVLRTFVAQREPAESQGYTCGICSWGRGSSPRSQEQYESHMAHEHAAEPAESQARHPYRPEDDDGRQEWEVPQPPIKE